MKFEIHNHTNHPVRVPVVVRGTLDYCILQPGKHLVEAEQVPNVDSFPGIVVNPLSKVVPFVNQNGSAGEQLLKAGSVNQVKPGSTGGSSPTVQLNVSSANKGK